ncbi:SDR family NAD(P)-dependent oxidoreductase [Kangiella sp. TOML190]|uniref:SDR family NAD(P)-dependent oxidoreductase n=1 Tax=Kangiella sp. TOML190 TaxID=2931351 RepID=UPI00204184DE|nr:SDR family NAD(P)-dependent oxidoreductase [Kangiella sp. TOML190]
MYKTILITGATDGIGFATAKMLVAAGHHLLLHGRSDKKLLETKQKLLTDNPDVQLDTYLADLSDLKRVNSFADEVLTKHQHLDVLINNAGVLKSENPITQDGLDIRFVVNCIAPYLLTKKLRPILTESSRVINLSSAAQAPLDFAALVGDKRALNDMDVYAQSKVAITSWSRTLGLESPPEAAVIAVNPGSLLASNMVKQGFGIAGSDINIGAEILKRAALSDEFASASGQYYDNDSQQFAKPHSNAVDATVAQRLIEAMDKIIAELV